MLLLTEDISVFLIGVTSQLKIDVFLNWGSCLPKHLLSFWRVVFDVQFGLLLRLKGFSLSLKQRRLVHKFCLGIQRVIILRYCREPLKLEVRSCRRILIVCITIHSYVWILLIALIEIRCRNNEEWTLLSVKCYIILKLLSEYRPFVMVFGALRLFSFVISQAWFLQAHEVLRQNLVNIIIIWLNSNIPNIGQFHLLTFLLWFFLNRLYILYLEIADLVQQIRLRRRYLWSLFWLLCRLSNIGTTSFILTFLLVTLNRYGNALFIRILWTPLRRHPNYWGANLCVGVHNGCKDRVNLVLEPWRDCDLIVNWSHHWRTNSCIAFNRLLLTNDYMSFWLRNKTAGRLKKLIPIWVVSVFGRSITGNMWWIIQKRFSSDVHSVFCHVRR